MDFVFKINLNPFLKGPFWLSVATLSRAVRCLCTTSATQFYRFLARFSGRRRLKNSKGSFMSATAMCSPLVTIFLVLSACLSVSDACSSRSTPKPKAVFPTARPNITFLTYECPPAYAEWFCLNEATCFTVKIGDSLLYNCECADGYMGQRCEYKDLDGSYLRSQQREMLETASIASGATIAVVLVVIVCIAIYIHFHTKQKELFFKSQIHTENGKLRPFSQSGSFILQREACIFQSPATGSCDLELKGLKTEV